MINGIKLPISNKQLYWQNYEELYRIVRLQTGPWIWTDINNIDPFADRIGPFLEKLESIPEWRWSKTPVKHIQPKTIKRVIDIGSGIGLFDITLHALNTDIECFLVDKSKVDNLSGYNYYSIDSSKYPFYNSWEVVTDCLTSSNIDKSKFHFISPDDLWPLDVDLIISMHSWCWNYPKELYWDKMLNSLKIGGVLILDVFNIKNRDIIGEISETLGSLPLHDFKYYPPDNHPYINEFTLINKSNGGCYYWIRQK